MKHPSSIHALYFTIQFYDTLTIINPLYIILMLKVYEKMEVFNFNFLKRYGERFVIYFLIVGISYLNDLVLRDF